MEMLNMLYDEEAIWEEEQYCFTAPLYLLTPSPNTLRTIDANFTTNFVKYTPTYLAEKKSPKALFVSGLPLRFSLLY